MGDDGGGGMADVGGVGQERVADLVRGRDELVLIDHRWLLTNQHQQSSDHRPSTIGKPPSIIINGHRSSIFHNRSYIVGRRSKMIDQHHRSTDYHASTIYHLRLIVARRTSATGGLSSSSVEPSTIIDDRPSTIDHLGSVIIIDHR